MKERSCARRRPRAFDGLVSLRQVGEHGGASLQIVRNAEETAARRNPREQHYLTEFANFRSRDGLYRKIRFFIIGGEILLRSMVTGKKWNLHWPRPQRYSPWG